MILMSDFEVNKEHTNNTNNIGQVHDPYHVADLLSQSFSELKPFTFDGMLTKAKICDVCDGDTVKLVFYLNNKPVKHCFRLSGYDAPELKPKKDKPLREFNVTAAKICRDYLKQQILGEIVWVKFCREDKYGRLMGNLYFIDPNNSTCFTGNEKNINEMMISKGYGKIYNGKQKCEFTEQELKKILGLSEIKFQKNDNDNESDLLYQMNN